MWWWDLIKILHVVFKTSKQLKGSSFSSPCFYQVSSVKQRERIIRLTGRIKGYKRRKTGKHMDTIYQKLLLFV